MEILIALLIGIVLTAVQIWYVAAREKKTRSENSPRDLPQAQADAKTDRAALQPDRAEPRPVRRPAVFDPATASPTPVASILFGSAYVVDGDTIRIQKTQIRLFGIDAPEMNHPYGKKAKWALVAMCKGQKVRAVVGETDVHGRTVAKCYLQDGTDLSAEMVKIGMAIDWPKYSGGIYRALETPDARKKLWLADARQKGRMHVWEKFDAQ